MLALALVLAAAPGYVDPYEPDRERPLPVAETPDRFRQVGFTGNVGAAVPLPNRGELGIHGGLGVRYGMRPPPEGEETYFTPAISVLLTGDYLTHVRNTGPRTNPLGGLALVEAPAVTHGGGGVDVRLELTVSRHGGMLMPEFATWINTGSSLLYDGTAVRPSAHVGFGLSLDFVRDTMPSLAEGLAKAFSGGGGGGGGGWGWFNLGNLGGGSGEGLLIALAVIVIIPVAIAAGIVAFFAGSAAVSLANVELRYTVLPGRTGPVGYGSLVLGIGI